MNKTPFSLQPDLDAFIPATDAEKEYMVQMRPASTFFKDGVKRLLKNKVATVSFVIVVVLALTCIFLPMFWPYGYDQQLGQGRIRVDETYNGLSPMTYGGTEREKMFGTATAQAIRFPITSSELGNADAIAAKRELATELYNKLVGTDMTPEAFAEIAKDLPEGAVYLTLDNSSYRSAVIKDKEDLKVFESKGFADWVWECSFFGNAKRTPGDIGLVEDAYGIYVTYFDGYEGGGESVFPHFFGTDTLGRDYTIRVVYGMRVSLAVGLFASIIVLIIGMVVGSIAGYCGGYVDLVIMRIVDIIYSLPDMLMVILLATVLKQVLGNVIAGTVFEKIGSNIISLFMVFGLLYWVSMSRLIRGQILSLREQEYVLSANSSGAKSGWIIRKHLIPNCISVIIISTALQIPSAIFTESYLSFLGLGVNAPMPSLGSLASDALNGIISYPYLLIIPAIVISLIVLSLNLFGDGLRDAFDPKLNG